MGSITFFNKQKENLGLKRVKQFVQNHQQDLNLGLFTSFPALHWSHYASAGGKHGH